MGLNFKKFFEPAFLICVIVLAVSAGSMQMAIRNLGVQLRKYPLPLQKSLDLMDEKAIAPYKVFKKYEITNKDIIEELGTTEYLQWALEDTEANDNSPVKYCSLFITYYTGNPDQVPHVPEQCYFGGGHQRFGTDDLDIKVPMRDPNGGPEEVRTVTIPMRCLIFGKKESDVWQSQRFPVMYFFKVNGRYAGNRTQTRLVMNENLFSKYSYFSKVEWKFFTQIGPTTVFADKQQSIEATPRFLSAILPVLERDHWPVWQKGKRSKKSLSGN
ncbi:MAG: hypothetical protein ABIG61_11375 [Planctomycetota bacterium]